ncbi:twin-arginine translocase TatA/TatE family subunit [Lagierella sp.]|uniref:twin-arginine translocase TatA/TatE family subunit n=1 Tax=Lagierella sp. TaxID=2849657 RepID=UPI0026107A75|nr:twin-arginine translocase TatA/TatE family subunit [Lagierella sp.]
MFGRIGIQELLVIFVIVLIIFGPKNLPDLGKTMGKTIKNFKDSINGKDTEEPKNQINKEVETKKEEDE